MNDQSLQDHIRQTIATYDAIAPHYHLTGTPELRELATKSMRAFESMLHGTKVVVAACGNGRDSRYLTGLGLQVVSFDLSRGMLKVAKGEDPNGVYLLMDLRNMDSLKGPFDGIYADGCLYHLTRAEFVQWMKQAFDLLAPKGVLYMSMKEGQGEEFVAVPRPGYPGGERARQVLRGKRFYTYYSRDELLGHFDRFHVLKESRYLTAQPGFEFWLRKRGPCGAQAQTV
jgi:SAM-dependent methyltransferase